MFLGVLGKFLKRKGGNALIQEHLSSYKIIGAEKESPLSVSSPPYRYLVHPQPTLLHIFLAGSILQEETEMATCFILGFS